MKFNCFARQDLKIIQELVNKKREEEFQLSPLTQIQIIEEMIYNIYARLDNGVYLGKVIITK